MPRPVAIDLFSGAGGMSLGFEQAGFDVVAAVELDPVHAAVHSFNFPECAVLAKSVSNVTGSELRRAAGLGQRPVDVVFGGAPCQGFSLIGHRALDDPRNALVREFVRVVREVKPRYFVFENVKGLTVGRHKSFLEEIVSAFSEAGYNVRLPWQVLNAAEYGVPQNRERLILVGARKGSRLPGYPRPVTCAAGTEGKTNLPSGPTCEDALSDLPDVEEFEQLVGSDTVSLPRGRQPRSKYARDLRGLGNDHWLYGYVRTNWDARLLTSSMRTHHTDISKRRFAHTMEGTVEPISRLFKLPRTGVANTLRAGTDAARGAFTSPRPIHYAYDRLVTVREMARLHGFPDWFRFHVTKWHGARQIGNAVPPPLARAIAREVMRALGQKATRPKKALELGDPALLEMDMAAAAEHWNVQVPIGKRNMKSGARKRRQHEIDDGLQAQV